MSDQQPWREFVEAIAKGFSSAHHQTQVLHCDHCGANLDDEEPHKEDCLMLRAQAFLKDNPPVVQKPAADATRRERIEHFLKAVQQPGVPYVYPLKLMDFVDGTISAVSRNGKMKIPLSINREDLYPGQNLAFFQSVEHSNIFLFLTAIDLKDAPALGEWSK